MRVEDFTAAIGADFYAGVPDSQLKALCNYLCDRYGISENHIIAANEGNAVALAAGHYMATRKLPAVYLQNSGIGNIVNPVASLLNEKVYGIPMVFIVGWRGEPGVHDEPQHVFQGEVTVTLLEDLGIRCRIVGPETEPGEIAEWMETSAEWFAEGKSVAFIVRKGALSYGGKPDFSNNYAMTRERAIEIISAAFAGDIVVSTTGKASRELFEIREKRGESHETDFLTVGSMGHASSVALSLALAKPDSRVVCIDGDGALLMHMGALAVEGSFAPDNLVHVVINNGSHETVGGEPVALREADLRKIAEGCGAKQILTAETEEELDAALLTAKSGKYTFLEVKTANGARNDLGRPTLTAKENIDHFMDFLEKKQ